MYILKDDSSGVLTVPRSVYSVDVTFLHQKKDLSFRRPKN